MAFNKSFIPVELGLVGLQKLHVALSTYIVILFGKFPPVFSEVAPKIRTVR